YLCSASQPRPLQLSPLSLHDALPISRSRVLNQCTIVFPQGAQPMPLNQPFSVCSTIMSVSERYTAFTKPKRNRIAQASSNPRGRDRKSTSLNSSHQIISYADFCLKKK